MDRERERERLGARSDAASLWIDFLLLPPKLEEHLAAGPAAIPSPPDLISMFLEQALLNQKAVNGGSSGNIANKDVETQGTVKVASKTASVLCERAARVAVAAQLTLAEIELSLASQQHQFVLLKTLIRHDEGRSLLHQCNLHRWLIHKALQCYPVGSAAPNVAFRTTRLGFSPIGDDLGEVFHNLINGTGDTSSCSCTGENRIEEEQASLEFLEQVLKDEDFAEQVLEEQEGVLKIEMSAKLRIKSSLQQACENGGSTKEQVLSSAYKCQVMFDVAEVHFMRGRIKQAYEFFIRCKESLSLLRTCTGASGKEDDEEIFSISMNTGSQVFPVPQDRLAGFIVACRMLLLGVSPIESSSQTKTAAKSPILQEVVPTFGAPSSAQRAVVACEQSRWIAREYNRVDSPYCDLGSGSAVSRDSLPKRESSEITRDEGMYASNEGRGTEDGASRRRNKRIRSTKYCGDLNGNSEPKDIDVENGQSVRNDIEGQAKGPHGLKSESLETQHCGDSEVTVKENFANGKDLHETKRMQVNGTKREQTAGRGKDGVGIDESHNNYTKQAAYLEKDQVMFDAGHGTQIKLVLDLKGESGENAGYEFDSVAKAAATERQQACLTQAFIQDILRGHLSWAYCSSVEKDPMLSALDRSKVAACNLVRSVLEGASVEIFLRVSDQFEDSKDSVEFLMQLLLAIKVMEEGNKSSTNGSCAVDSRQEERLTKLGFSKQVPIVQGTGEARSVVLQRVHDLAIYVCCVIDEPWCWDCAVEYRVARKTDLPSFDSPCPIDWLKQFESSATYEYAASVLNSSLESDSKNMKEMKLMSESDILMSLVQLDTLTEIEAFVEEFCSVEGRGSSFNTPKEVSKEVCTEIGESSCKGLPGKRAASIVSTLERSPVSHQSKSLSLLSGSHQGKDSSNSEVILSNGQGRGGAVGTVAIIESTVQHLSTFEADVASIFKGRAFTALNVTKDIHVAKRLYELALGFLPGDLDCVMMLWLFERTADTEERSEGGVVSPESRSLPAKSERGSLPSSVLLDLVILFLIEKELWHFLTEICKWALSLWKEVTSRESELNMKSGNDSATGGPGTSGTRGESSTKMVTVSGQSKHQKLLQTLKLGTILSDLLPLCISLQAAASRNHFNEDVARLGSTLSQLFEDFMCVLIGVESDGQVQGSDDTSDWRVTHSGMNHSPRYTGAAGASLISKVSNPRALMALASLTAGWLQRCHAAGLSTWPLAVERYGVLAGATAGATLPPLPGSLPYASSVLRPVPPRVPPEFGRDLFGVLLETIVSIPGVVEGDREKGHRWLQGLADLAFEDDAHVKALRLYLQAGAIRSAHYCDRSKSMCRDIFTRWVIQRMVAACRAIGAGLQAAVLCQCPPAAEHELAFRILQENTLIVDRDAAAYFECLWEVPILELLVNLHAKAGDEERVNNLIGLLQQPALNVHNPPAIRQAHICTMEQRFLQRLAGELLD